MRRSHTLKTIAFGTLVGLFGSVAGSRSAVASDLCSPVCRYAWATKYVDREVAYTKIVVLHDHCGRPYEVARTCFATVSVPVRVRVLICD